MFIAYLGKHNIHAPGVLNKKKLAKGHITSDKHLENQARGYTEQKPSTNKSSKKITVVGWNDNRAVYLASNCLSSDPAKSVCRWKKVERKYIEVKQPNRFYCYNRNMSFADKMDQRVAKCRIGIQMKKWWWVPFAWMVDVALVNPWILHRVNKEDSESSFLLLAFLREVLNAILESIHLRILAKGTLAYCNETLKTSVKRNQDVFVLSARLIYMTNVLKLSMGTRQLQIY